MARNGGRHDLVIFESNTDVERPFTYRVDYVRVSFVDDTSFEPEIGAINQDVPTDGTLVQLSHLRNVDDGREDGQQQSGGSQ